LNASTKIVIFLTSICFISSDQLVAQEIIPSDRRIDWEPGIPGGIPDYPVGVNVTGFGAAGDGITDDTEAIQSAIDSCGNLASKARDMDPDAGYTVYLPAGTYLITSRLTIDFSGVALRGAGPGQTIIQYNSPNSANAVIGIFAGGHTQYIIDIISGYTKGSTAVTLSNTTGVEPGSIWLFDQLNDGDLVSNTGIGGTATYVSRENGSRAMGQLVKITAINGNSVTFEPPLYLDYNENLHPQATNFIRRPIFDSGIEDLTVELVSNNVNMNITLETGAYNWVKNVESINCNERHVNCLYNYRTEIRDSYFHHASNFMGGHGYGVLLGLAATACLVENNIFYFLRHSLMPCWGAAGNVLAYNYSVYIFMRDEEYTWFSPDFSGTHGAFPVMNLFEGNTGQMIDADYYWGTGGYQTFFRNRISGFMRYKTSHLIAVNIEKKNLYNNLFGNVLGVPVSNYRVTPHYEMENKETSANIPAMYKLGYESGADGSPENNDPEVKATLLRHGNYDYVTESVIWDSNISEQDLPASFYLGSKPEFFGNLPWPPHGPDVSPLFNKLPAQIRFEQLMKDLPADPTNLIAEFESPTCVILYWQDNAYTEEGYKVERSTDGAVFTEIGDMAALNDNYLEHAFTDAGLTTGNTYYYRVYAYNHNGHSDYPNLASVNMEDISNILPVAWFKFDGNSIDSSVNNYPNEVTGNPAITEGKERQAYRFNGEGDYIAVNWDGPIQGADKSFTIAAWINPANVRENHWVLGDNNGWNNFIFGISNGALCLRWRYDDPLVDENNNGTPDDDWVNYSLSTQEIIPVNSFSHIAATYNAHTKSVSIYFNGIRRIHDIFSHPSGIKDVDDLYIGRGSTEGTPQYFDGIIDEVYIFDLALPASKIQEIAGIEIIPIDDNIGQPDKYYLYQNYPNPFNAATVVQYGIPEDNRIVIAVYDLLGKKVRTLVNKWQEANWYAISWDGKNDFGTRVASGLYIISLNAKSSQVYRKALFIK
jgi:hypothetical protein